MNEILKTSAPTSNRCKTITNCRVAVVIPCFKVKSHILEVLKCIPDYVHKIYVVDDCCPEESGLFVESNCKDSRVSVLFNKKNLGVGGAVIAGYRQAIAEQIDVIVKIDGDGQMDANLIPRFINPIIAGEADYCKGNRFYNLESLAAMPPLRLFGNSALSFVNKAVSGYWNLMDPTNGYTAISRFCLERLALNKIDNRYFFESDILFRLGTLRAVVKDIPMDSVYESEKSNLRISRIIFDFPPRYLSRLIKRIFYNYFLRDFAVASIALIVGTFLLAIGSSIGIVSWINNSKAGTFASTGTVMLATLPILVGVQLLLIALVLDIISVPKEPLSKNSIK